MTARMRPILISVIVIISILFNGADTAHYFGKFLGKLSELHHGVSGEVYAVDGRTLYIKDFTYDGQGPAAYFFAGNSRTPGNVGFRLRDENGSSDVLRRYRKEGVTITLPEGKTLNSIKLFYVWCEEFAVNFGDVKIPRNFDYPRPQKIEPLKGVHSISSDNIVIVDAQTLLIPNLSYDGEAPDAKFWVGRGPKPSPQGIRVPDENGKEVPLRKYDRKTVVLTLPGGLTVFDIGHFGIWCEAFTVDFGHVQIPQNLNVPPSLKMLGVSPQSKLNCEVLYDDLAFEVRWAVAGDSIVLQLVAKLDDREYMSFGLSGDESKSVMIGGDVAVAWVDRETLKGSAEDYYLDAKSQCSGPSGSCPDNRLKENTNSVRLLNAAMVNGYSIVTYQRLLAASDKYDLPIHTNKSQAIIWAIGPLNQRNEVSFHSHYTKGDQFLDFGRAAKWNCPMPESEQPAMKPDPQQIIEEPISEEPVVTSAPTRSRNSERRRGSNRNANRQEIVNDSERSASTTRVRQQADRRGTRTNEHSNQRTSQIRTVPTPAPVSKRNAWVIPPIKCDEPEDGVFYAQMGPTGGKQGYPAITGHVGWGISWYINGLLIPEINVIRGKTYTFVVEGGSDPEVPAKFHPFYITDDSVGGYEHKTQEEKKGVKIFAGSRLAKDGSVQPTGTGRLCHWTQQGELDADDFESFGAYQRTLELKCDQGEPGVIEWTPDKDTPDTVYYQCFTHRYLGWKINVHDSCDTQASASELEPSIVPAPLKSAEKIKNVETDLEESPSIRIETRVKPNDIITKEDKEDKDNKSAVSEKNIDPSKLDPPQNNRQPQMQILNEPILIQPQQSYFNPQPLYMNQGSFFTQNAYNNPYIFENPFYDNPYQQSFKPSPTVDSVLEETKSVVTSKETSTSVNTVSTTELTTTTLTNTPKNVEKPIVLSATELKQKIQPIIVPVIKTHNQNTLTNIKMTPYRQLETGGFRNHRPMLFRTNLQSPPVRYVSPKFSPKKPIYRPVVKMPIIRPLPISNKPMFFSDMNYKRRRPSNVIIFKSPILAQSTPIVPAKKHEQTPTPNIVTVVKNVEVSPQQASTEKEPEIQTAPSTELTTLKSLHIIRLHPALNTGFHPESVVIENGFKPIVSKEFQKRISNNEPELEYESEIGVINVNKEQSRPQYFEPMFLPSPIDKVLRDKFNNKFFKKPGYIKKIIIKQTRSLDEDSDDMEPIPAAAEKVESYYLPPLTSVSSNRRGQSFSINTETSTKPSIDSPPDVVVTYDGKKVSGASLTAKLADRTNVLDMRVSKAAELIKAGPQFVPFRGELPPLNSHPINMNAPQLQSSGYVNRELDTPPLPVTQTETTRLAPTKQYERSEAKNKGRVRRKRAPHHTPEHVAEQMKENSKSSVSKIGLSVSYHISIILVAYFLYLI